MIINKIYYILPIIFISFLIKKFIAVTCFLEKLDNLQLYSIFYTKVISKEQFIITYENGVTVESHWIDAINKRLALIWEPEKPRSYYLGYPEIRKDIYNKVDNYFFIIEKIKRLFKIKWFWFST